MSTSIVLINLLSLVSLAVQVVTLVVVIQYREVAAGTRLMIVGLVGEILARLVGFETPFLISWLLSIAGFVVFSLGLWRLLRDVHSRLSIIKPVKDPLDELA